VRGGGNNALTASRMNCASQCWRKHFWQYEVGLRRIVETSPALRFGSAWARSMEARWRGKGYKTALAAAVPEGSAILDEYAIATLAALLKVYYEIYGKKERFGKMNPEVKFTSDLVEGFTAEGVIDGLGSLADGRSGIIESKTTADSLAPDSDFWLRLTFNVQVYQYIVEARKLGWDIATVYYDVTRKPSIRPKQIGKKEEKHLETPDEFSERLYEDAKGRPEFYFARREVPVIDDQLEQFRHHRELMVRTILFFRSLEVRSIRDATLRDAMAWPRNVSSDTCDFCQFKSFCLNNISVDINHPPEGYAVQTFNPELK